jgi:hypothetical protein
MRWIDYYDEPKEAECVRCHKHMDMAEELRLVRTWSKCLDEQFYNLPLCNDCRRKRHERIKCRLEEDARQYDEHFTDDHGYWRGG